LILTICSTPHAANGKGAVFNRPLDVRPLIHRRNLYKSLDTTALKLIEKPLCRATYYPFRESDVLARLLILPDP
jgi:hypothetical protein